MIPFGITAAGWIVLVNSPAVPRGPTLQPLFVATSHMFTISAFGLPGASSVPLVALSWEGHSMLERRHFQTSSDLETWIAERTQSFGWVGLARKRAKRARRAAERERTFDDAQSSPRVMANAGSSVASASLFHTETGALDLVSAAHFRDADGAAIAREIGDGADLLYATHALLPAAISASCHLDCSTILVETVADGWVQLTPPADCATLGAALIECERRMREVWDLGLELRPEFPPAAGGE